MPPKCFQTLDNGQRCSAPAILTSKYCRHHDPETQAREARMQKEARDKSRDSEPLFLPPLLDKPSMLSAVNLVVHALAEGRIKSSAAETLICAIKFANRLLNDIQEAGLSLYPAQNYPTQTGARPTGPTKQAQSSNSYITGAVALAASGNHSMTDNPLPERFLEEMMAQAHAFPSNSPKPDPRFTRP